MTSISKSTENDHTLNDDRKLQFNILTRLYFSSRREKHDLSSRFKSNGNWRILDIYLGNLCIE